MKKGKKMVDPITLTALTAVAMRPLVKPTSKLAVDIVEKIKDADCSFGISGGISLLTGTPDITIGFNCSDSKNKS